MTVPVGWVGAEQIPPPTPPGHPSPGPGRTCNDDRFVALHVLGCEPHRRELVDMHTVHTSTHIEVWREGSRHRGRKVGEFERRGEGGERDTQAGRLKLGMRAI